MPVTKSAIQELKDQFFVDTADGEYLTNLAGNFGVNRPLLGFSDDDIWRAVVRRLALDAKSVRGVFHDLLTIMVGPKHPTSSVLSIDCSIGESSLYILEWMNIPQIGTLIIDKGLASEETIEYSFRDPTSGVVLLKTPIMNTHTAITDQFVSNFLATDVLAGATTITVENGSLFPDPVISGSYPILLDANSKNAETVVCTAKSGNDLTVSALSYDHNGPYVGFVTTAIRKLSNDTLLLFGQDLDAFSSTGLLYVQEDGGALSEFVRYSSLDKENHLFNLETSLVNTYTLAATINEAIPGATVQLAQVFVDGVGWDIFETEQNKVKIYLPDYLIENRLVDAPYLHKRGGWGVSTLASPALIGDKTITVSSASAFTESGTILIDAGGDEEYILYTNIDRRSTSVRATDNYVSVGGVGDRIDVVGALHTLTDAGASFTADMVGVQIHIQGSTAGNGGYFTILSVLSSTQLTWSSGSGSTENPFTGSWYIKYVPAGATRLYCSCVHALNDSYIHENLRQLIFGTETVSIVSIDPVKNTIDILPTTTKFPSGPPYVSSADSNILHLARPLEKNHLVGISVSYYTDFYPGTSLEKGQIYTTDKARFQGKYLWSFLARIAESTKTTLTDNIAGPTYLEIDQKSGRTAIEVNNAAIFLTDYQTVQIGKNLASWETKQINDITLRQSLQGMVLGAAATAGDTQVKLDIAGSWPEANGYRVHISNTVSSTAEEVVIVTSYTPGTQTATLDQPLQYSHNIGEPIQLMADVLTIDALEFDQFGRLPYTERYSLVPRIGTEWESVGISASMSDNPATIQEERNYITVASAAGIFPNDGSYVKINFGRNKIVSRGRIGADYGGNGTKIDFLAGVCTLTCEGALVHGSSMTGQTIHVRGSLSGNDGDFVITGTVGWNQITYNNGSGSNEDPYTGYWWIQTNKIYISGSYPTPPFWVVFGEGTREAETRLITTYGSSTLTLATPTQFPHKRYEFASYLPGEPTEIYYSSKVTGGPERFVFDPPIVFDDFHASGEPVALSRVSALPTKYGSDWPFYLPSDWTDRLELLVDLARAAGVQVVLISDR